MTGKAKSTLGQLTQGARPKKREPLKVGRHSKLTPEISKRICDAVRAGNFIGVAARYAGVSDYTVHQWISRGRGEHPDRGPAKIYVDFVQDLDEAEAHAEVAAVLHWRSAMPKDWKSASKWLEVRQPERWGEKPPEYARTGAFAGVNIQIGATSGTQASKVHVDALPAPISELLEENPTLIAGTMEILDQFLPIGTNRGELAANVPEDARNDAFEAVEGQFRTLEPDKAENAPNDAESAKSGFESPFGGLSDPLEPDWDN